MLNCAYFSLIGKERTAFAKKRPLPCSRKRGSIDIVLIFELLNAPAAVHELLLTREVRMASGTHIEANFRLRRFGLKRIPASAGHLTIHVCGVNFGFHDRFPPSDLSCTVIFVHPKGLLRNRPSNKPQ
jgi:hypothetical protein